MSDDLIERIADRVAERVEARNSERCDLTNEERQAVRELIATKKNAVKAFFWLFGAFVLWVLKDLYSFIIDHLTIK